MYTQYYKMGPDEKAAWVASHFRKGNTNQSNNVVEINGSIINKHKLKEVKESKGCFDLNLHPSVSVMSNDILRSGLFSSAKRIEASDLSFVRDMPIAAIGNTKISLTGYTLNQVDYQVYESLVKQFKVGGIDLEMRLVDLVKLIGWAKGGNQLKSLITSLNKLHSARIKIDTPRYQYIGGLVDRCVYEKSTGIVNLKVGTEIAKMYASDNWTMLQVSKRSLLGKNMLARWIYGFMMTHKDPFPYKIEKLMQLSGNCGIQKSDFKAKLKKACILINEKLGWECKLVGNLLHVKRKDAEEDKDSRVINTESV